MQRANGRQPDELRPVTIQVGAAPYAEGSALISCGNTRVLCAASVEPNVPAWLRGQGRGWVTAEYALLPRATHTRNRRERTGPSGRTQEIQRLIGRALRAAVDLEALGERLITIDCDVIQADGGTRTAAITGGWVALVQALDRLRADGLLSADPLLRGIAAVSAGVVADTLLLDLDYAEDSTAAMDCNLVLTDTGAIVEIQGTAEGAPVARDRMDALIDLAGSGIRELLTIQRAALARA
jgi:ribonuclease PH